MGKTKQWAVGDTCYLKSGSPQMTVIGVAGSQVAGTGKAKVAWVAYATGELHTADLPFETLATLWYRQENGHDQRPPESR